MKLPNASFWVGSLSLMGVLYFVLQDVERTAPGELTTVHGAEEELTGRRSCSECHGSGRKSMADSCLECHTDVRFHIDSEKGLHGSLEERLEVECALCHSEHHGEEFEIVNARSFELAGADRDDFDHAPIGFEMDGKHLDLECTECHALADKHVLGRGEHRFMGLNQDCATCHDDPHGGTMVRACADCHGQHDFLQLSAFDHGESFSLVGRHASLGCRDCHAAGDTYSLEALVRPAGRPRFRGCQDCHADPHDNGFIEGVARFVASTVEGSCSACHEPAHDTFTDPDIEVTPELHARSGFALDVPHHEAACADCHAPVRASFERRFPGRNADRCRSCHDDPHEGQFDHPPFARLGCISCHDRVAFEPHAFTVGKHAYTSLPLEGAHLQTECAECHELPAGKVARVFKGTPALCAGCHADAHRGFFDERVAGGCAACHDASTFSKTRGQAFDHGAHAGFALRGAHAQATCEACHPRAAEPDAAGRTLGFASEHFGGRVRGCGSCHEDVHKGRFDQPGLPREVEGRSDCARCHVETSFRSFEARFDHGAWTGFPLDGAHASVDCSTCHKPLRTRDATGRRWMAATGSACADCHDDPHAGQFRVKGGTDCSRCHKSATSFTELAFNHNRHARFPLDRAHRDVACDACHLPWTLPGGEEVIRYRPLGMECVDCHGVNRDQLRPPKEGNR